jgi:hypothetical protein
VMGEIKFDDPNFGLVSVGPIYRVSHTASRYSFSDAYRPRSAKEYLEPLGRKMEWSSLVLPGPWKSPD